MKLQTITAEIDLNLLQQKANEYAQKGAEDALKEFYTSYNSPYKKAIEENLQNKGIDRTFDIPDIIGVLNEKFTQEVDIIANTAISKTFIPMIKEFLTRVEPEIKFSMILEEFIKATDFEHNDDLDYYDYTVEIVKDDGSFMYLTVSNIEVSYEIHFYLKSKKEDVKKVYEIYTLPYLKNPISKNYTSTKLSKTMKISLDGGATLEMPFTTDILTDKFMSFIAKLVIGNTQIHFDVTDFDEDMFPRDECHC